MPEPFILKGPIEKPAYLARQFHNLSLGESENAARPKASAFALHSP